MSGFTQFPEIASPTFRGALFRAAIYLLLGPKGAKSPRSVLRVYQKKLILALYGAVNSGKTSAGKTIFGVDSGTVHPIPGSTKNIHVVKMRNGICVADTPGLEDVNEDLVKKAKDFADNVDIFVYLVNANGGITEKSKADLEFFKAIGRPLLVVLNKIDLIPSKLEELISHQRETAGVASENFIASAFDPNPQISPHPINVEDVKQWIEKTLTKMGEELLVQKQTAKCYEIRDEWGLVNASGDGCLDEVERRFKQGSDVNCQDIQGHTPLMSASGNGRVEVATFLLDQGAEIDAEDNSRYTALMHAVTTGQESIVRLLLRRGADVSLADCRERTALSIATSTGNTRIAQILVESVLFGPR